MKSALYKLCSNDVVKGLVTAVLAAVIMTVWSVVSQNGFDAFATDWTEVLKSVVNVSIVSFFAYIIKNLLTDENGRVLGVFGE